MKLSYKILWVDNEDGIYNHHKNEIETHLKELGFNPDIKFITDFKEYKNQKLDLSSFDLFILDYKLKNGENGNKIVKDIREGHSIYTEILFYSSVPEQARKQIFDDKLNGVYVSSRKFDDFEEDSLGLIDVTIKKTQDVNNLRGLIMAEVAELDRIKEQIIVKATFKINDKELEKYILRKVESSLASNRTKLDTFTSDIDNLLITELLGSRGLIDSDKKRLAVGKTLEKLSITEPIDKITFLEPYKNHILTIRNNFAHVEESDGCDEEGNTCKLIGSIPFTEKKCIEIRQEIKKYKDILLEIKQKLNE